MPLASGHAQCWCDSISVCCPGRIPHRPSRAYRTPAAVEFVYGGARHASLHADQRLHQRRGAPGPVGIPSRLRAARIWLLAWLSHDHGSLVAADSARRLRHPERVGCTGTRVGAGDQAAPGEHEDRRRRENTSDVHCSPGPLLLESGPDRGSDDAPDERRHALSLDRGDRRPNTTGSPKCHGGAAPPLSELNTVFTVLR